MLRTEKAELAKNKMEKSCQRRKRQKRRKTQKEQSERIIPRACLHGRRCSFYSFCDFKNATAKVPIATHAIAAPARGDE